jgi:hypothetical protein
MIKVNPQPQRWHGHWLWLNYLYTEVELWRKFALINGVWCE